MKLGMWPLRRDATPPSPVPARSQVVRATALSLATVALAAGFLTVGGSGTAWALAGTPALTEALAKAFPSQSMGLGSEALTPVVESAGVTEAAVAGGGAAEAAGGGAALIAAAPEVAVAAVGVAAIYGAWQVGTMISSVLDDTAGTEVNTVGPSGVLFSAGTVLNTPYGPGVGCGGSAALICLTQATPSNWGGRYGAWDFAANGPLLGTTYGTLSLQCRASDGFGWPVQFADVRAENGNGSDSGGWGFVEQASGTAIYNSNPIVTAGASGHGDCISIPYASYRVDTNRSYTAHNSDTLTTFSENRTLVWTDGQGANVYWWQECQAADGTRLAESGFLTHPATASESLTFPACAPGSHRIEGEQLSGRKLLLHFKIPASVTRLAAGTTPVIDKFNQTGATPAAVGTDASGCTYGLIILASSADCTSAEPSPSPSPSPTSSPSSSPCIAGGCIGAPAPGSDGGACFPSGWAAFNPLEWVYKPVKCVLTWAFVPTPGYFNGKTSQLSDAYNGTALGSVTSATSAIIGTVSDLGASQGACTGPGLNLASIPGLHGQGTVHVFNACDGVGKTLSDAAHPLVAVGYWLTALFVGGGMVAKAFGIDLPWSKSSGGPDSLPSEA